MKNETIPTVLVVDDDRDVLASIELLLLRIGLNNAILCHDGREVVQILENRSVSLILLDLELPYITGEELLKRIHEANPELPVVILTATHEVRTVVRCIKAGAVDYVTKPIDEEAFSHIIFKALEDRQIRDDMSGLKEHLLSGRLNQPELFTNIITNNARMIKIFQYIESIAAGSQPVLITGESGTGKELVAHVVHSLSGRHGCFETVNVASVDDAFFTDTLFGHRKGSYSGAFESRKGFVEKTSDGTLFLDEIGDLGIPSQLKLLRLIEYREYSPLGSDDIKHSNARIVAATNKELTDLMNGHTLRKDLYYRFTHTIHLPPLRERMDDIPLLVDFFLEQASREYGKPGLGLSEAAASLLNGYTYPENNIRELRKIIFNSAARSDGDTIQADIVKIYLTAHAVHIGTDLANGGTGAKIVFPGSLPTIREAKEKLIEETLARTNGSLSLTARILGISRMALYKWQKNKSKRIESEKTC